MRTYPNAAAVLDKQLGVLKLMRDKRMKTSYNLHERIRELEDAKRVLLGTAKTASTSA